MANEDLATRNRIGDDAVDEDVQGTHGIETDRRGGGDAHIMGGTFNGPIRGDTDLRTIGLDSLGYLNLLEGLERTFGVAIDLDQEPDHSFLHTIDNLARYLIERRGKAA